MTIMGLDSLVEARIERAIERGDLTDLPGQGRPILLEDDTCVAPELRLAYRILKNERQSAATPNQGLSPLPGYIGTGNGVTLPPSPTSRILLAPSRRTSSIRMTAWNGT